MNALLKKVFGSKNEREIKRMRPLVAQIGSYESGLQKLSDEALGAKTEQFRKRLADGTALDDLLPEAFAVCREVSRRKLGMRHFDVQLIGGIILHEGNIAEMKTGEGKTLVATLALYLNALEGKGSHLVTVNDYLAKRDAQWMSPLYHHLGLSVGVIQHESSFLFDPTYEAEDKRLQHLRPCSRQEAYRADITYGTNNEFGFDYLRDNMVGDLEQCVQRELNYAIVDEVDSILIDEARTPLIISGPTEDSTDLYYRIDRIIPALKRDVDYTIEEKTKTAALTEEGNEKVERALGVENLYDAANMTLVHHVVQGLRAHVLYHRDVDYVVKDGEVLIVDEFTGRLMPGRRWSDGLHQAVEAKEGVKIANENQTLASITFQNLFRMYEKLAGMTGTADTEAGEFAKIYNLDVLIAPTNRPNIRQDFADVVYRTEKEKFNAIVEDIADCHKRGQPVLVGTISIEKSERLAGYLVRHGIKHNVLNAKHHEREAEIIAQAGRKGAVTIATNMAGRGTDILLGGNAEFLFKKTLYADPEMASERQTALMASIQADCDAEKKEVVTAGGLHIIGTERHESRRIDNQLRGRSGRQGDPGSSRFYLSLEDDLLRIFGSERISKIMLKLGMEEGVPIEAGMVTRAIENAQKKVEAHHFEIRKQLLDYDDVLNKQREVVYERRRIILSGEDLQAEIQSYAEQILDELLDVYCPKDSYQEDWDLKGLADACFAQFSIDIKDGAESPAALKEMGFDALRDDMLRKIQEAYAKKEQELGAELLRYLEKMVLLRTIDTLWKDHLLGMDSLREGIGLRGYGQKDPLIEYKREAFDMFAGMMDRMQRDVLEHLFRVQVVQREEKPPVLEQSRRPVPLRLNRGDAAAQDGVQGVRRAAEKVGRNDPCPCGSGKKYKKCHGT
ncbi:MAG: preprotein translocase subunit SecA [Nitrospirae bacterium]|nr:MAG: preprotein translocase subunit SecA [Nitrospirota bacterium]